MFDSLSENLQSAFKSLRGKGKLTESNMADGLKMVETSLLEADVSISVVDRFMKQVSDAALGRRVLLSLKPHEELIKIVYEQLVAILGPVDNKLKLQRGQTKIIMLCGLQGAGKTTTCGKLSQLIKEEKLKPYLVAADLQRPAAIEQLHVIGRQLNVGVFSKEGAANPVAVCQEGIAAAKAAGADVVILDTAGRLAIDQELMNQLKEIDKHVSPDQVLLVVDGMTGQDAVNSAGAFNDALELDGVIMTKLDGDARGGALLSVKAVTDVPILFLGTGEHMDALEPFRPEGMASRILQMGDIVAAAREAHRLVDEDERASLEESLKKGQFGLVEFRQLMQKFSKPGLMQKMMGLMPGMGEISKMMAGGNNEKELKRISGIIDSMTPSERKNPKIIDNQRRHRIAAGAGATAPMVNEMLKQFDMLAGVMQMMAGGGMKNKMAAMAQMQGMMGQNPMNPMMGMKTKQSTGKRLTPKEKERLMKEREKAIRKAKRDK